VIVVCALETWLTSCMMTGQQLSESDQNIVGTCMILLAVIWPNDSRAGLGCKLV